MILYAMPGTCSLAPHIALIESQTPFVYQMIDPKNKKTREGHNYLNIHPLGLVPAIAHPELGLMTEVTALLEWIHLTNPSQKLLSTQTPAESYQTKKWLNFIASEIHKGFSPLFDRQLAPESRERLRAKLMQRLNHLHKHLSDHKFIMGSQWTLIDAYLFTVLQWAEKVDINLDLFPLFKNYLKFNLQKESVQKAIEAESQQLNQLRSTKTFLTT